MSKTIRLEIVTPAKKVFSEDVSFIVAPGSLGELGILPDHAPLVSSLTIGVLRYKQDDQEYKVAISGGFLEVKNNKAVVLATTAERPEDIDAERAQEAKKRAEDRLANKGEIDVTRAEAALKRAINRLKVVGR